MEFSNNDSDEGSCNLNKTTLRDISYERTGFNHTVEAGQTISDLEIFNSSLLNLFLENMELERISIKNSRLSGAVMNSRLVDISMVNCSAATELGFFAGSTIENSKFENIRMEHAFFGVRKIDGCVFTDCDISQFDPQGGTKLRNTYFSGKISNVVLLPLPIGEGSQLDGVDFSDSVIRGCKFPGVDVGRAIMPDDSLSYTVRDWGNYRPLIQAAGDEMILSDNPDDRVVGRSLLSIIFEDEEARSGLPGSELRGDRYCYELAPGSDFPREVREAILRVYSDIHIPFG